MRRILILFVFLAGIGAAAFVYLDSLNASKKQISREPSRVQIENAGTWYISRQIEQQRYKISLSVPGTHPEPKVYSIRGSLMATGERPDTDGIPFYAAIVAICDNWSELDCWKLRSISIAGQDQLVLASLAEPAAGA
ncbi:MAG: hypothetical protein HQ503_07700, partial [Rhodospirillales bacterium]|nr:hypothetical protein [Rhodospirillales bacterium]